MIPSPTDTEALANRINLHTRDAHNKIDTKLSIKMAFVMRHDFIYIDILKTFYLIFQTIESNIDSILISNDDLQSQRTRDILNQFFVNEFRRTDKIYQDLSFFKIDTTTLLQDKIDGNLPPRLNEFIQYIEYNVKRDPVTILAYCHVLYLALFAGGKIFKSSFMRNIGFLNNYKTELSQRDLIMNVTNFFQFADHPQQELKLKLKYKENYDLATRDNLTEQEKLMIIQSSRDIFRYIYNIFEEIGQSNKEKLLTFRNFRIISFLLDEWKYDTDNTKSKVLKIAFGTIKYILLITIFLLIWTLLKYFIFST
ncbi:heme-binding protein Hmx1p [Monosporozyma servazzii]